VSPGLALLEWLYVPLTLLATVFSYARTGPAATVVAVVQSGRIGLNDHPYDSNCLLGAK
jgi:hypothetical protein